MTDPVPSKKWSNCVDTNIDVLRNMVNFAYETGYHEMGYDVVSELVAQLRAATEPGAALVNVLPKITDEVVNLLWGTDLIESDGPGEKWGWSQGAVDFACLLNEGLNARRAAQPPDRASVFANADPDSKTFAVTAGQVSSYEQPVCEPLPDLTEEEMPEPSLDVLKRVAARMRVNAPDTAFLAEWAVERIEELEATFELRWKADMRAIKRWQEANPGNDLTWPDHADMVVWMLDQMDARAAQPPRDGQ